MNRARPVQTAYHKNLNPQVTNDIVKPLEAELGEIRGCKTLKASMDSVRLPCASELLLGSSDLLP